MESNEQTELTIKIERLIDKEQAESSKECGKGVEGLRKKEKREKELMDTQQQQCSDSGGERHGWR